jgi:hypothetical protein
MLSTPVPPPVPGWGCASCTVDVDDICRGCQDRWTVRSERQHLQVNSVTFCALVELVIDQPQNFYAHRSLYDATGSRGYPQHNVMVVRLCQTGDTR